MRPQETMTEEEWLEWIKGPEEMAPEEWAEWVEYFTDPVQLEEWRSEGRLRQGMTRGEVANVVSDLVALVEDWSLDRVPAYAFRGVVDRIYRSVNA